MEGNVIQPNGAESGGGETYSATETAIGTWFGQTLYRKVVDFGSLPSAGDAPKSVSTGLANVFITDVRGIVYTHPSTGDTVSLPLPFVIGGTTAPTAGIQVDVRDNNVNNVHVINITTDRDRSQYSAYVVLEYIKNL